jgi:hypothetical protein
MMKPLERVGAEWCVEIQTAIEKLKPAVSKAIVATVGIECSD